MKRLILSILLAAGTCMAQTSGGNIQNITGGACTTGQYAVNVNTSAQPGCAQVQGTQVQGDGVATDYLNGQGAYTAPSGGGGASLTAANTFTTAGAASAPSQSYTGATFTGGTGSTTYPFFYINKGATSSNSFNTAGETFGINEVAGYSGNFLDLFLNANRRFYINYLGQVFAASVASVAGTGAITFGTTDSFASPISTSAYNTSTNCSSSASPAVCSSAAAGQATVAASATTEVVNTTAVTANSEIMLTWDSSLGTRLGVTCNTTTSLLVVTARTAGTSFTVSTTAPTTNPACFSYTVIN